MYGLVNLAPTTDYVIQYSEPLTQVSKELIKETTTKYAKDCDMLVHPVQSRMLKALVKISKATNVLELGCFTGHSAISMAEGLPENGSLITCELNPVFANMAREYIEKSSLSSKVVVMEGPALETLEKFEKHQFDMVFMDADKINYINYYETILARDILKPGGFIAVDNVLWNGEVVEVGKKEDVGEMAVILDKFNKHVAADPRTTSVIVPVFDGLTLIYLN